MLGVLDLGTRAIVRTYPLGEANRVDAFDDAAGILALHGFDDAATFDPVSGVSHALAPGSGNAYTGTAFANGRLYVASFNRRVVYSMTLDGGDQRAITPYPGQSESGGNVAGPCTVTASPDEASVLMGDEVHNAVHRIRTADDTVVSSNAVGFPPCEIFFRDATTAVVVGAGAEVSEAVGQVAVVDLSSPSSVPRLIRVPHFKRVTAAAYLASRDLLFLLHGGRDTATSIFDQSMLVPGDSVRLVAVDIATGRVRKRWSLGRRIGVGWDIAMSPDGGTLLVGSSKGVFVQTLKLR